MTGPPGGAGFFYAPGPGEADRVQCVGCGIRLAQWAAGDDVWPAHRSRPARRKRMARAPRRRPPPCSGFERIEPPCSGFERIEPGRVS